MLNTLFFNQMLLLCNALVDILLLILYLDSSFRFPSEFVGGRVGIITPYKSQLSLLRSRFSSAFGSSVIDDMEFNTVDGFQGREVDILLLSTVRAGDTSSAALGINSSSIGFVADVRRMNVALTRAKLSLWILGNIRTLQANNNWAALLKDARKRNLVISVTMPYQSMFKTAFHRDNHSGRMKHVEKVKDASRHALQIEGNQKRAFERKTRNVRPANQSKSTGIVDEKDLVGTKDSSSLGTNGNNGTSEDVKSAISGDHAKAGERKSKESSDKKVSLGNAHTSKRKAKFENSMSGSDKFGRESGDGHNLLKSQGSNRPKKSCEADRSQGNQATPSTEGSLTERDAKGRGKAPSQVGSAEDLIAKRKQQREAVNAILNSSLISSKKSETSMKHLPAKRALSSSNVCGSIEPPKTRKGTLFCLAALFYLLDICSNLGKMNVSKVIVHSRYMFQQPQFRHMEHLLFLMNRHIEHLHKLIMSG